MSKAEEIIKTRLKRVLRGQASYVLSDKNINDNQKREQMMVIEELMSVLNKENIIDEMSTHEYTVKRTKTEEKIMKMEEKENGR